MSKALLLPREHGAYVQLLAPLTFAWLVSTPTLAALLLTVAAISAFVANEPLLVLLGHRGRRLREQSHHRAVVMLWVLAPVTVIAGSIGLVVAGSSTRFLAVAVALPTAALVALGFAKRQRSFFGESIAVIALTGAAAPIAAAGHGALTDTLATWAAWAIGFGCSTVAVHRVIERGKQPRQFADVALALGFAGIACVTWMIARRIYAFQLAVPLACAASIVSFIAPPPAKLRKIGFAMVGAVLVAILVQL